MMGFSFLAGIVLGCLTIARLGDVYGRKPIFRLGLIMHLVLMITITFLTTQSILVLYVLLVLFGMSVTARYYVGYSYNIEMQPLYAWAFVSTFMFLAESLVYILVCFYFMVISKNWVYVQVPNIALTVLGICFLTKMPESPKFLLSQGKTLEATEVLKKIAEINGHYPEDFDKFELSLARPGSHTSMAAPTAESSGKGPDLSELRENKTLKSNLFGCIIIFSMNAFNFYLLTFFMKYFPGSIFSNTLAFAFSDVVAFILSGFMVSRMSIKYTYKVAFIVSFTGGVLFIFFETIFGLVLSGANMTVIVAIMACLCRMGGTMAFNIGYISVPRRFPVKFQSTVYAIVPYLQ